MTRIERRRKELTMYKSIFVPLNGGEQDSVALGTAVAFARLFESHLECARVRLTPEFLVWEGDVVDVLGGAIEGGMVAQLEKQDRERTTKALRTFKKICEQEKIAIADAPGAVGLSARWNETRGHQVAEFVWESRFHDLAVVARDVLVETDPATDFVGALLLDSGRAVLLAREEAPKTLGKTVAIAWKNTPEAARAVTAAMPILALADEVVVLSANEGEESIDGHVSSGRRLAATLQWNGCNVNAMHVTPGGRAAAAVLEQAVELGCDLLVMGGYGHSRLRETVFGGFTRDVLETSPLPVFMFH
jgi:nucleotide-binding universal stress UspA family protein